MTKRDWIIYQNTINRIKELSIRNEPRGYCDLEGSAYKYIDKTGKCRVVMDFDMLNEVFEMLLVVDSCRDALLHNPHMQDKRNFTPATRAIFEILVRDATPREKGMVTFPREAFEKIKLLHSLRPFYDLREAEKKKP